MPVKGTYLLLAGIGGVFAYSGIAGKNFSDALRLLAGGESPSKASAANTFQPITSSISGTSTATYGYGQSLAGGNAGANQTVAKLLALAMGHPSWTTGQEWTDWVALWNQESGWSQTAQNSSSGAYGIPQALPYTKMPKSAWPPADGGSSNVQAQISWGISYIASVYGSPSAAWAHEESQGWY